MYSDGSALEQLSRHESLQLMASVSLGRIIYTRRALPAVEVVNFALDHGDIIVRTDGGGKLAAATQHSVVAFEADCLDAAQQAGWSVTAIGQSQEVTDPAEIGRLQNIGLSSWAPGSREHFIRISPEILNGRRLTAHSQEIPADHQAHPAANGRPPVQAGRRLVPAGPVTELRRCPEPAQSPGSGGCPGAEVPRPAHRSGRPASPPSAPTRSPRVAARPPATGRHRAASPD